MSMMLVSKKMKRMLKKTKRMSTMKRKSMKRMLKKRMSKTKILDVLNNVPFVAYVCIEQRNAMVD